MSRKRSVVVIAGLLIVAVVAVLVVRATRSPKPFNAQTLAASVHDAVGASDNARTRCWRDRRTWTCELDVREAGSQSDAIYWVEADHAPCWSGHLALTMPRTPDLPQRPHGCVG